MEPSYSDRLVCTYAEVLRRWAVRRTGDRDVGEELAQDVLCALVAALRKQTAVDNMDAFVWRIAHRTWCQHLRRLQRDRVMVNLPDLSDLPAATDGGIDAIDQQDETAHAAARLRQHLANLGQVQRQCVVLYYMDGLTVAQTAQRLALPESTVKWYLFDTRRHLKEEMTMPLSRADEARRQYRPGSLRVSICGEVPIKEDMEAIAGLSRIQQNICLVCYHEARTSEAIADCLGIPLPYFEEVLQ